MSEKHLPPHFFIDTTNYFVIGVAIDSWFLNQLHSKIDIGWDSISVFFDDWHLFSPLIFDRLHSKIEIGWAFDHIQNLKYHFVPKLRFWSPLRFDQLSSKITITVWFFQFCLQPAVLSLTDSFVFSHSPFKTC